MASDSSHLKNLVSYHAVEPWRRRVGPNLHERLSKLNEAELVERARRAAATEEQLGEAKRSSEEPSSRPFECFSEEVVSGVHRSDPDASAADALKMFNELQNDSKSIDSKKCFDAIKEMCGELSKDELLIQKKRIQEMFDRTTSGNQLSQEQFTQLFAEASQRHQACVHAASRASTTPHHQNLVDLVMHLELCAQEHKRSELGHLPIGQSMDLNSKIKELQGKLESKMEQEASRQIDRSCSTLSGHATLKSFAEFENFWCDDLLEGFDHLQCHPL